MRFCCADGWSRKVTGRQYSLLAINSTQSQSDQRQPCVRVSAWPCPPACLCTYLNQSTRFQKMVDDAWLDVRNW